MNRLPSIEYRATAFRLLVLVAVLGAPLAAQAYVGPGAGLSLLSALWGLLCAIGAAFLFVILWPIRRLRRRRREAAERKQGGGEQAATREAHDASSQAAPRNDDTPRSGGA